jgi:hypothetical protein
MVRKRRGEDPVRSDAGRSALVELHKPVAEAGGEHPRRWVRPLLIAVLVLGTVVSLLIGLIELVTR